MIARSSVTAAARAFSECIVSGAIRAADRTRATHAHRDHRALDPATRRDRLPLQELRHRRVVQVRTESGATEDLSDNWAPLIANPARRARIAQPELVVLTSAYRQFFTPFVDFVANLASEHPDETSRS